MNLKLFILGEEFYKFCTKLVKVGGKKSACITSHLGLAETVGGQVRKQSANSYDYIYQETITQKSLATKRMGSYIRNTEKDGSLRLRRRCRQRSAYAEAHVSIRSNEQRFNNYRQHFTLRHFGRVNNISRIFNMFLLETSK